MKIKLAVLTALAAGAVAMPAMAAKTPPASLPNSQYVFYNDEVGSGTFGATINTDPSGFSDQFQFQTFDSRDLATVTVTYGDVGSTGLNISGVTFNGLVGKEANGPTAGTFQYSFSDVPITAAGFNNTGFQEIVVTGTKTGSFSGTIDVATASAAPEPSAWVLMMAGVAGMGLMLRRARKQGGLSLRSAAV